MNIIIDDRERLITPHLAAVAEKYPEIKYVVRRITVGDYIISINNRIIAVIERKTWRDLAASMIDGRKENVEKLKELRAQTGCLIFYFIEGSPWPDRSKCAGHIPYSSLMTHINHLIFYDQVHIQYVKNEEMMAQYLFITAHDYTTIKPRGEDALKKMWSANAEPNLNADPNANSRVNAEPIVAAAESKELPHIPMENIVNQLNQIDKKINSDKTCYNILLLLDGVGKGAAHVLESNGIKLSFFYKNTEEKIREMLTECSKNCENRKPFNSLITNKITSNKRFFTESAVDNTRMHIQMLSCIRGISMDTARLILENISFFDIFRDAPDDVYAEIKEIKRACGRKLGADLAERVVFYFGLRDP